MIVAVWGCPLLSAEPQVSYEILDQRGDAIGVLGLRSEAASLSVRGGRSVIWVDGQSHTAQSFVLSLSFQMIIAYDREGCRTRTGWNGVSAYGDAFAFSCAGIDRSSTDKGFFPDGDVVVDASRSEGAVVTSAIFDRSGNLLGWRSAQPNSNGNTYYRVRSGGISYTDIVSALTPAC